MGDKATNLSLTIYVSVIKKLMKLSEMHIIIPLA